MGPPKISPSVKSFLIADQVFRQEGNNKWCLIGVFDTVFANKFPTMHPSLGLYLQLADAHGLHTLRLEFADSAGRCLSTLGDIHIDVPDRLAQVGIGFQSYHLLVPAPGTYFLNLLIDGSPTSADIRLHAVLGEGPDG